VAAPVAPGSTDWDEVSDAVANAYFPHDLHPLGHARAGKARADGIDLGPIRIAHISWGAAVSVVTTGQDEFIARHSTNASSRSN